MEAVLTGLMIALVVMGAMSLAWRVNMVVKKPEQYRQFRELEAEFLADVRNWMRRQARVVSRAVWGGCSIVKRIVKR